MIEPITFVMERKMLQGIKERGESHRFPDTLLDQIMPEYEFRGIETVDVHASPEQVFRAFRELKASDMPLAELLGQIRYLPARLDQNKRTEPAQAESFSDAMLKMGFVSLGEEPNLQILIGAIGKFHELADQQFVHVHDAEEFQRFLHEDYQRLAISVRISDENSGHGCKSTLEHRTHAMSEHACKQFARYWLAIKPGGGFVTRQLLDAVKRRAEKIAKPVKSVESRRRGEQAAVPMTPIGRQQPTLKPEPVRV